MKAPSGQVFYAISDPTRRELLDLLTRREYSVNDLVGHFRVTQPAVSHHLRILREAGLVKKRQQGRHRLYRLHGRPLREVYDWVAHYQRFWTEKLEMLGEHLRRNP
ncbi:MAG TPA: metalloregulator ArsR/SmtB family transcription factor [Terriglobales bacterium]|nr:metalloregulator ArsR/SmtB family transcription factor [Terriglobales bacterium]